MYSVLCIASEFRKEGERGEGGRGGYALPALFSLPPPIFVSSLSSVDAGTRTLVYKYTRVHIYIYKCTCNIIKTGEESSFVVP